MVAGPIVRVDNVPLEEEDDEVVGSVEAHLLDWPVSLHLHALLRWYVCAFEEVLKVEGRLRESAVDLV